MNLFWDTLYNLTYNNFSFVNQEKPMVCFPVFVCAYDHVVMLSVQFAAKLSSHTLTLQCKSLLSGDQSSLFKCQESLNMNNLCFVKLQINIISLLLYLHFHHDGKTSILSLSRLFSIVKLTYSVYTATIEKLSTRNVFSYFSCPDKKYKP